MTEPAARQSRTLLATNSFLFIEHSLYVAIGGLLAVVAAVALVHAGIDVITSIFVFDDSERLLTIMDQLLFVLMLVEILHTVSVSIRSGSLNAEPFLVVGLIASIRRVLVITLESSKATKDGGATVDANAIFQHSMVELGVLGMLIFVMVVSIFLLRRTREREGGGL